MTLFHALHELSEHGPSPESTEIICSVDVSPSSSTTTSETSLNTPTTMTKTTSSTSFSSFSSSSSSSNYETIPLVYALIGTNGKYLNEVNLKTVLPKGVTSRKEECEEEFMNAIHLLISLRRLLYDASWSCLPSSLVNDKKITENNQQPQQITSVTTNNGVDNDDNSIKNDLIKNYYGREALNMLSKSELWNNVLLEKKLSDQLNPLAVVTGAVPHWVRWLPKDAPFLWSLELRLKAMKFMAFGVSRAIVAMQEIKYPIAKKLEEVRQMYQLMTAESLQVAQQLDEQISAIAQYHATSQLAKNTLLNVSNKSELVLLHEAFACFENVEFLRGGILEVEFQNESGHGSGVTAGFYARVARALASRSVGLNLSHALLWPDSSPSTFSLGSGSGGGALTYNTTSTSHKNTDGNLLKTDTCSLGFNSLGLPFGSLLSFNSFQPNNCIAQLLSHSISPPFQNQSSSSSSVRRGLYVTSLNMIDTDQHDDTTTTGGKKNTSVSISELETGASIEFAVGGAVDNDDDEEDEEVRKTMKELENESPLVKAQLSGHIWEGKNSSSKEEDHNEDNDNEEEEEDDLNAKNMEFPISVVLNPISLPGNFYLSKENELLSNESKLKTSSELKEENDDEELTKNVEKMNFKTQTDKILKAKGGATTCHDNHRHLCMADEKPTIDQSILQMGIEMGVEMKESGPLPEIGDTPERVSSPSTATPTLLLDNPLALFQGIDEPIVPFEASPESVLPSVGECLELWCGSKQERTSRSIKVTIHRISSTSTTATPSKELPLPNHQINPIRLVVSGMIPKSWPTVDDSLKSKSSSNKLFGSPYHPSMWVPDNKCDLTTSGSLENPNGLFPCPLPIGCDATILKRQFKFLGRLFGKALVDGFMVPLRLHPAFFSLVRGESLPLVYLASKSSHMMGSLGEPVALLFNILPLLEQWQDMKNNMTNNDDDNIDSDNDDRITQNDIDLFENKIFDATYEFTSNMTLRDWIDFYWVDPITKSPLSFYNHQVPHQTTQTDDIDQDIWTKEVSPSTLLEFLQQVGESWLGFGIHEQVNAFREGLSDLVSMEGGLLSFEARELKDLFCGPDTIDWTEESLLKILRPTGGLTQQEDTMKWLRAELVAMPQALRLDFMELTSGLRLLTPDKVITVRRTDEKWPFFHSCTNQLDMPRYTSSKDLHDALIEALAHGGAGGFSEFAHISSGNGDSDSNNHIDVRLQDRRQELLGQSSGLSRGFGFNLVGNDGIGGSGSRASLGAALSQLQFDASDAGLLGSLVEALNSNREGIGEASQAASELRHALMDIGLRMGMEDEFENDDQNHDELHDEDDQDDEDENDDDEMHGAYFEDGDDDDDDDDCDEDDQDELSEKDGDY
eukprot:CAMPEP_0114396960 /NCGR_PEP_ID=MMETSP0102-20121206/13914_1 /TAXON_ID=38822 ORGANISM="Pteridomonas danica, Strain PT" /NCGR_SAMPLE_ID=MMETSP0102 /ASSEMBLY_ACC=CAM_ASM_000212 /LENGTH=1363 /DNA_ID=CAMNT_0001557849 /DNA_START=31 /DNA_END=4123 /DNA_ORIENTATION=-